MDIKKENRMITFLVVLLVLAVFGITIGPTGSDLLTGKAVTTTPSRAIIESSFSIDASDNLSDGIEFKIAALPIVYANATYNNDSITALGPTLYNITVSLDSNVNVDFCVNADAALTDSSGVPPDNTIELPNYTWSNSTLNTAVYPEKFGKPFTTSYVADTQGVIPGDSNHYRFWLNVTNPAQDPGTYENNINFQGVPAGDPCN